MSLRIPLSPDLTLQTEFHEIERRLRKLEKTTGVTVGGTTSTRLLVSNSTTTGTVNLQPIYDRLNDLENAVANLPEPITTDFGGVGVASVHGLVPAPGTAQPPTGVAGHVLLSDGTWGFPFRGLVQVATSGTESDPALDVITILGGLSVLGSVQASELVVSVIHTPGWMACCDDELSLRGLL